MTLPFGTNSIPLIFCWRTGNSGPTPANLNSKPSGYMLHHLKHLQILYFFFCSFSHNDPNSTFSTGTMMVCIAMAWAQLLLISASTSSFKLAFPLIQPNLLLQTGFSYQNREYLPRTLSFGSVSHPAVCANQSVNYTILHYPNPFWDFSYIFGVKNNHALGFLIDLKVYSNHICLDVNDTDVQSIR